MILSNQEKSVFRKGYRVIAGIDEAGRGSLAGPVAAAVVTISNPILDLLNKGRTFEVLKRSDLGATPLKDSKLLSAKQREEIFEIIKKEPAIKWRVSFVWPTIIDRINIWQATLLAWRRSLKKLNPQPDFLFLDGKYDLQGKCATLDVAQNFCATSSVAHLAQRPIVKGDQKIFLLCLASIMAKVSRDRLMRRLEKKYPEYGFAQHKGYGTKLHFERLAKIGPCLIHRRSFQPVFANLPFAEKIYYIVSQIPCGQVLTYQQVAQKIGQPRAYRAVGNALNKNRSRDVPCHRVIRSNGQIGGFQRGSHLKENLLKKEKAI